MATTPRDYTFKYDVRKQEPLSKLHPDEPWFFIRAQDALSPETIQAYADLLKRESDRIATTDPKKSSELLKQALGCLTVAGKFMDWQDAHKDLVKLPD